ncbi:accessory cholera enterotoxin [Vibrio neptunius]|uniref:DUF2523 family protein n=1 Tax=Vibrio neptunius TaxID=170651 RepID=UPI0005FA49ED|nr:DUF2523 family protein [Vibrio neptunius]KJY87358.1 accessory cholera enterotoxin [Vibrio neptunius]
METILSLLQSLGDAGQTVVDFFHAAPSWFEQIFIYLNAWYVKIRLVILIKYLELTYRTAEYLLNEIGVTQLIIDTFNALPSEVRFYAFLFKVPQAISIYLNFIATGFVIKITRM